MQEALAEANIDLKKMPLGNVSHHQITVAYSILKEVVDVLNGTTPVVDDSHRDVLLVDASNRFCKPRCQPSLSFILTLHLHRYHHPSCLLSLWRPSSHQVQAHGWHSFPQPSLWLLSSDVALRRKLDLIEARPLLLHALSACHTCNGLTHR